MEQNKAGSSRIFSLTETSETSGRGISLTRGGKLLLFMTLLTLVPAYVMSVSLLFLMASMFLAIMLYNFLAVVRALNRLHVGIACIGELFAQQEGVVQTSLHLKRKRGAIHHLRLKLEGENMDFGKETIPTLHSGQPMNIHLRFTPQTRGMATLLDAVLEISHPFGLVTARKRQALSHQILVYPALIPQYSSVLYGAREEQGLVPRSSDDFVYLTTYQPGEDVRRIHWKKSAILEQPVLRKDLTQVDVVIPRVFVPDQCPHFEFAVSVLATHFAQEHHLSDWEILTQDGLKRVSSREEMLNCLALVEPLSVKDTSYEEQGYEVIYASQIEPGKL